LLYAGVAGRDRVRATVHRTRLIEWRRQGLDSLDEAQIVPVGVRLGPSTADEASAPFDTEGHHRPGCSRLRLDTHRSPWGVDGDWGLHLDQHEANQ